AEPRDARGLARRRAHGLCRPQREGPDDLDEAVRERRRSDPDDEQERFVPKIARRPVREPDLHTAEQEQQPPGRVHAANEERRNDLEEPAQEKVEREHRRQRLEAVARVDEGENPDDREADRERDPAYSPPPVRDRDREQLEDRAAEAGEAEQQRDRGHAPRVELEDEEREEEPEDPADEEDPPEVRLVPLDALSPRHDFRGDVHARTFEADETEGFIRSGGWNDSALPPGSVAGALPTPAIGGSMKDADARLERIREAIAPLRVAPGSDVVLERDFDSANTGDFAKKGDAKRLLETGVEMLRHYQERLAAQDTYGLLVALQALDAGGKDSTIRHVMSGVNPQGVVVHSFRKPSAEEIDHDFLWRYAQRLPARGQITIFNRSHYEEVLVVRVHPQILESQKLPPAARDGDVWARRYRQINDWERFLVENGFPVVKLFLNL